MQKASKRIGAIALAACLLVALVFGGVMAWAGDSGLGGSDTLLVNATSDDGDLDSTDVTFNVYKIATATKDGKYLTYNYEFDAGFEDLAGYFDKEMSASKWQALADAGKTLVEGGAGTAIAGKAGEQITGLTDGLYLVVTDNALTDLYEYTFLPTIVSLPTKEPLKDEDGNVIYEEVEIDGVTYQYPTIMTSYEGGDWLPNAEITLKYTREPRYGDLVINKTLTQYVGVGTFVYHITSTDDSPFKYENYASIYVDSAAGGTTTVKHIKAGTKLSIVEEYTGARYEIAVADNDVETINANKAVQFDFQNKPNGSPDDGHGIENHFTKQSEEDGGDWAWEATPASEAKAA